MGAVRERRLHREAAGRRLRWAATVLAVLAVTACGGGDPAGVAVRVGSSTVPAAAVQHWMAVIAASASTAPGQPIPKPPDPPGYSKCVAYLHAWAPWAKAGAGRPAATPGRLKAQCEYEYEKLKLKALVMLIGEAWVKGEAAELGMHTSEAQLAQRLALLKASFPSAAALQKFLMAKGVTLADLLQEMRESALVAAIQQKLEHEGEQRHLSSAERQQALERFGRQFLAKWIAKTVCQPGYMVTLCRQYSDRKEPLGLKPPAVPLTNLSVQ